MAIGILSETPWGCHRMQPTVPSATDNDVQRALILHLLAFSSREQLLTELSHMTREGKQQLLDALEVTDCPCEKTQKAAAMDEDGDLPPLYDGKACVHIRARDHQVPVWKWLWLQQQIDPAAYCDRLRPARASDEITRAGKIAVMTNRQVAGESLWDADADRDIADEDDQAVIELVDPVSRERTGVYEIVAERARGRAPADLKGFLASVQFLATADQEARLVIRRPGGKPYSVRFFEATADERRRVAWRVEPEEFGREEIDDG